MRLWNAVTGIPPGLKLQKVAWPIAMSADGKVVLAGSKSDKSFRVYETGTGTSRPLQYQGDVHAAALSADGKFALTGNWDKTAQLWDTGTGKPVGPAMQHNDRISEVALSADGKIALTACGGNTAWVWDTALGKRIGWPLQHPRSIGSFQLSADGNRAAIYYGRVRSTCIWETKTGLPVGLPFAATDDAEMSADGRVAATIENGVIRFWDIAKTKRLHRVLVQPPKSADARSVALSGDGRYALTIISAREKAQLWSTGTGEPIGAPLLNPDSVFNVFLDNDGKTALTTGMNWAQAWDAKSGKPIGPASRHHWRSGAAIGPDGKAILIGGEFAAKLEKESEQVIALRRKRQGRGDGHPHGSGKHQVSLRF